MKIFIEQSLIHNNAFVLYSEWEVPERGTVRFRQVFWSDFNINDSIEEFKNNREKAYNKSFISCSTD